MTKKLASILVLCLQLACGVLSTPEPTATLTPLPTSTFTPVPTATVTPTHLPLLAGKRVNVPAGGFSLLVVDELEVDVQDNTIGIFNEEGTLIVSFVGTQYESSSITLENVIDDFLSELETKGGEFNKSEPSQIFINGIEGIYVDVNGNFMNSPIKGRAVAVSPQENFIFFGLGISNLSSNDKLWEESGSFLFHDLLDYVNFTNAQPTNTSNDTCEISIDETYGYTQENPIQVGGDFLEGPARERAYLDNLLGPNGESLSYERQGSFPTDTTILDIYIITGSGINETLYLDEYNYSEPQAPVGFTCKGEFPMTTP